MTPPAAEDEGPSMTGTTSLSALMEGDHHDLDEVLVRFRSTPGAQIASRRELFTRFASGLRRHISLEERRLFPRMEEGGPESHRLVEMLLEDHRRIEGALVAIQATLDQGATSTEGPEVELLNLLGEHNAREEGFAYPWLDEHLPAADLLEVRHDLEEPLPPSDAATSR